MYKCSRPVQFKAKGIWGQVKLFGPPIFFRPLKKQAGNRKAWCERPCQLASRLARRAQRSHSHPPIAPQLPFSTVPNATTLFTSPFPLTLSQQWRMYILPSCKSPFNGCQTQESRILEQGPNYSSQVRPRISNVFRQLRRCYQTTVGVEKQDWSE